MTKAAQRPSLSQLVKVGEVKRLRDDLGRLATRQDDVTKLFGALAEAWQYADAEAGARGGAGLELARASISMLAMDGTRDAYTSVARTNGTLGQDLHDSERDLDNRARAMLGPIVTWLRRSGQLDDVGEELAVLRMMRPDVTKEIVPDSAAPDRGAAAEPALRTNQRDADETEAMRDWLERGDGDDGWRGEPTERRDLIDFWVGTRPGIADPSVRARADARLLAHAVASHQWLPAEYAEALHDDDEIWGCEAIVGLAHELRRPLDRETVGLASASLLNVRLATLVPMVFLRAPGAPMIAGLAETVDLRVLPREHLARVATYLLTMVQKLNSHIENPKQQPRKTDLRPLMKQLELALVLLRVQPWKRVGEEVEFDPVDHECDEPLAQGTRVRVTRPGLRSSDDPDFLVKAWVEPLPEPLPNPRRTARADSGEGRQVTTA